MKSRFPESEYPESAKPQRGILGRQLVALNVQENPNNEVKESERKSLESMIDLEAVRRVATGWQEYISKKIASANVVLLGQAHTVEGIEVGAVMRMLPEAKRLGVTDIGLEVEEQWQPQIDRYYSTGKFLESDDPSAYERWPDYQKARIAWHERRDDPDRSRPYLELMDELRGNFVFEHINKEFPLIKAAKELGIRIRCVDGNQSDASKMFRQRGGDLNDAVALVKFLNELQVNRDLVAAQTIKSLISVPGNKVMVLFGAAHVMRRGLGHDNLCDLLKREAGIPTFSINLDRDLNADREMGKHRRGENINSVLYSALTKAGIDSVGFDLSEMLIKKNEVRAFEFPFDGYVKL